MKSALIIFAFATVLSASVVDLTNYSF